MALDLSKLKFFGRLSARSRVAVLLGAVIGVTLLIYFGSKYLTGGSKTTGPSRVASAPQGLQSVQGGQITPEYYRALMQANAQAAQQAKITGGSAVSTLVNIPGQAGVGSCIICSDQSANVKNYLDDWLKQGKVSPDVASELEQLADKNVPVDEYAAELDRLVKEGKLTPEQARLLLEQYKKQHANALLQDSAKLMDGMIKSGELPLDAANQLLDTQRAGKTPAEYAAELQRLVKEGKISPQAAQRLLAQYAQQFAKEVTMKSIAMLQQWSRDGQITPDVLTDLVRLENDMVPLDTMATSLQGYVAKGKLTPAVADKVLAEFKAQKAEIGSTGTIEQLIKQAEAAAFQEISDLLQAKKITPEVAAELTDMIQNNVPLEQFKANVAQLVQQNKLTPEIGQLKIGDYQTIKNLRDEQARLANLQANNVTPEQYAEALKQAVAAGTLTPQQAAQLMQEYQATTARGGALAPPAPGATQAFAALQQRVQAGAPTAVPPTAVPGEFAAVQAQVTQETLAERQARLQAMVSAMSGQAQQLIGAWQPPTMEYRAGSYELNKQARAAAATSGGGEKGKEGEGKEGSSSLLGLAGAPVIKAGSILFATLDTAVNSDYPDSPVLATIVAGPLKGAKLLGKIVTAKSVSGQLDRVSLNFTIMNLDAWPKSKNVTAYAIDPDTARVVLASSVNYHYMQRYGAIMATSFLQGYATSITNAGTSTTGIFGTSTTHPSLGPGQKIAVGLGQIGQNLGQVTQNYVNIPPTVRVDSGVGLGILFMSDVT
jgi:type IV secretory pathway VirB10-like protein